LESIVQIDQAIFTSARTEHGDGYQLVARSPGVTADQARELAVWGPSHDALHAQRKEPSSVNFHRLKCGTCIVSKTFAAGEEYSNRGGARVYTQFLLLPPGDFARFANSPFAVLRAAWAKGILADVENPPATLESFTLAGRSPVVDHGVLTQFVKQFSHGQVGRLVSAALEPGIQLIAGTANFETLFGGLLNCFPVECRTELTFTTGLRYSPRRPFHLAPLIGDEAEKRRAARCEGVSVVDLSACDGEAKVRLGGWAGYVVEVIRSNQLPRLAAELKQAHPGLSLATLDELGEQLLSSAGAETVSVTPNSDQQGAVEFPVQSPSTAQRLFRTDGPNCQERADAQQGLSSPAQDDPSAPKQSRSLFIEAANLPADIAADPQLIRLLEELNAAVCETVEGSAAAMENTSRLWKQLSALLNLQTLSTVREQCLRHALMLWHACDQEPRQPQRAIDTLDLLDVLFDVE
jgi:GTPase-associated protein 1, N-terminal domain type 2